VTYHWQIGSVLSQHEPREVLAAGELDRRAVERRRLGAVRVPAARRRPRLDEPPHGPAVDHGVVHRDAERQPAPQPRDLRSYRLGGELAGVERRRERAEHLGVVILGPREAPRVGVADRLCDDEPDAAAPGAVDGGVARGRPVHDPPGQRGEPRGSLRKRHVQGGHSGRERRDVPRAGAAAVVDQNWWGP